ncbi:hypothetical protein PEKONANI_02625 [Aeromonas jandaei]
MGRAVISCTEVIFSHRQTAYFRQYDMLQASYTPYLYLYFVMCNYVALSPFILHHTSPEPLLRRFDYANVCTLILTLALTTIGD